MVEILERLRFDHNNLVEILKSLEEQISTFESGRRPDYELLDALMAYCLDYPDLFHHPYEDAIFRQLTLKRPAAAEAVGDLLAQHEGLAALTKRLAFSIQQIANEAEVPREAVAGLAREFLGGYRAHMRAEETVFFPTAEACLSAEDWNQIARAVEVHEDPIFKTDAPEAYHALRKKITRWHGGSEKRGNTISQS